MDDNFKASEKKWSGTASVWLLCKQKSGGVRVLMTARRGIHAAADASVSDGRGSVRKEYFCRNVAVAGNVTRTFGSRLLPCA